jgi:hypothetical protein
MPNRIIKESIARSEKISNLTDFQFRLWVHLITYVDDFGRGDARPAIIKGSCFPFRERLANKDIEKGIAELADAGCVGLYKVDGKPYLYLPNWDEHQRVRNKVSRFPSPEDADEDITSAASCGELPQVAARIQNPESESRIQNPNPESKRAQAHEDDFERFWSMYPRKEGKQKAKTAFAKADVDIETLLDALADHKKSAQWTKNNGEFIPHASTWLNGRRWEDQMSQNYDKVPKGASGVIGEAETYFIQRALREE